MNKYPSRKLTLKTRFPKSPFFILGDEYDVSLQDGRKMKAGGLMPGDAVILPMPLFPGTSMDLDCTIMTVELGPLVPKPAGIGCFYMKEDNEDSSGDP